MSWTQTQRPVDLHQKAPQPHSSTAACRHSLRVPARTQVWRPHQELVLNSNPPTVALQLTTNAGPLMALSRFFQV